MKKKIAITTICALVILISMTSTLFAAPSSTTKSYDYKFRNVDPWVATSTSYGVTTLSRIVEYASCTRNISLYVKVQKADGTWKSAVLQSWPLGLISPSDSWSISSNSDSKNAITSVHITSLVDASTKECIQLNTVGVGTYTGTKTCEALVS